MQLSKWRGMCSSLDVTPAQMQKRKISRVQFAKQLEVFTTICPARLV